MAQNTEPSDDSKPKERANIVGKTPLDYSKWEDLDFESDEDDCHPNIEIGTWRRLKERMRREKGIKKKEPYLVDKWNVTTTNKNYAIDPTKPPKTTQEQEQKQENTNETNTSNTPPPKDNTKENKPITNDNNNTKESTAKTIEPVTSSTQPEVNNNNNNNNDNNNEDESEPYKARSNPQIFLDNNLEILKKYAQTKKDSKADKCIKKHPNLVHEAAEGYLITYAVDRAVEGAGQPELARLSRRCLMIHNLVQSCSQQNVSPQIGVERFYNKIHSDKKLIESYRIELNKQVRELMERIEIRRIERLKELQDIPDEYDDEEKAPIGPGGLDPTEVLNSLPKEMQDAFVNQDIESLKNCLGNLDKDMAEYHMKRCIDAGLWVQPIDDDDDDNNDDNNKQENNHANNDANVAKGD